MTIKVTYNVTDVYMSTTSSPIYINVSYSGTGGGGGEGVWGEITGTLSDQTDLQNALDGKYDNPTGTTSEYIRGDGTLATFPTIGVASEVSIEVRNNTGSTIPIGTVVYINGALGNKPTIAKAIATGDSTSAQTLGVTKTDISNNAQGYVIVIGKLENLDTSAYSEGTQLYLSPTTAGAYTSTKPYAPNHLVYVAIVTRQHPSLGIIEVNIQNGYELAELHDVDALNPSNNDGIFYNSTSELWEHKSIASVLGYTPGQGSVTSVSATAGTGISVSGSPITSSGTLTITNTAPDQVVSLTQGGTTTISGTYPNFTISSADQYTGTVTSVGLTSSTSGITITGTPVTTSGNLNLEIATASGSANGLLSSSDWTTFNNKQNALTNPITGTGATGQVSYWSGTNTQTGSNNFTWNDSTKLLSLTTEAAGVRGLYIGQYGNIIGAASALFYKSRGTIASPSNVLTNDLIGAFVFNARVGGTDTSDRALFGAHMATSTGIGLYFIAGSTNTNFTPALYIHPSGNTILGTSTNIISGTPTDSGQRLQVQGDAFIKGSGNTSGSTALTVQNSDGSTILSAYNNALVYARRIIVNSTGLVAAGSPTDLGPNYLAFSNNGTIFYSVTTGSQANSGGIQIYSSATLSPTTNTPIELRIGSTFAPTSGTATYTNTLLNPTINQTGGANGITRGLYVNPTLTAAADWRSIEMSNNSGWGIYQSGASANNYFAGKIVVGTTTVSTFALDVNGTARVQSDMTIKGSGNTSGSTALTVQNSDGTNILRQRNDGVLIIGSNLDSYIMPTSNGTSVDTNARGFIYRTAQIIGSQAAHTFTTAADAILSGGGYLMKLTSGLSANQGSAATTFLWLTPTINQTGTATHITRGLYVNPTLTAAADWRAIEAVSASNANHTLLKLRNSTVDVFTVKADSKIGFFNATPVAQPTTGIAEATFVENSGGTAINVDSTFAGYTLQQIAQALKDLGVLA